MQVNTPVADLIGGMRGITGYEGMRVWGGKTADEGMKEYTKNDGGGVGWQEMRGYRGY